MAGAIDFGMLNTNAPAQIGGAFGAGQQEARQNRLAQLAAQQQEQAFADDQATREAYKSSAGDQNKLLSALNSGGQYKAAASVQKQMDEQKKAKIDNAVNSLKVIKYHAGEVFANPTMDSAMSALQQVQQSTGMDQSQEMERLQATGGDPNLIRQWAAGHAMEVDKMLPKFEQFSNGAAQVQGTVDPLTGKFAQTGAYARQASPESVMADDRMRSEGAANRGVQLRGQNMVDSRARENASATVGKPFEVTGPEGTPILVRQDKVGNITRVEGFGPKPGTVKPPTEFQGKSAGYGARAEEADRILNGLETSGQYSRLGAVTGGGTGLANTLLTPMMSGETQKAVQAQRDFVNAVLRQESGAAISPAEFDNAKRQYFPQPGEGSDIVQQKAANRKLAIQGFMNNAGNAAFHANKQPAAANDGWTITKE